jgi:hypothetical protein
MAVGLNLHVIAVGMFRTRLDPPGAILAQFTHLCALLWPVHIAQRLAAGRVQVGLVLLPGSGCLAVGSTPATPAAQVTHTASQVAPAAPEAAPKSAQVVAELPGTTGRATNCPPWQGTRPTDCATR